MLIPLFSLNSCWLAGLQLALLCFELEPVRISISAGKTDLTFAGQSFGRRDHPLSLQLPANERLTAWGLSLRVSRELARDVLLAEAPAPPPENLEEAVQAYLAERKVALGLR